MKTLVTSLLFTILLVLFPACDKGGGSSSNDAVVSQNIGYFLDSPVVGLYYDTESSKNNITKDNGSFEYAQSDTTITFHLGSIILGSINVSDIPADGIIYIQDIIHVARTDITNDTVIRVATLLQSLDTNINVNQITLNQADLDAITQELDIKTLDINALLSKLGKSQKSQKDVIEHLGDTMRTHGIMMYNYTPQAKDSSIETFIDVITNGNFNADDKNDKFLSYSIENAPQHGKVSILQGTSTYTYTPESGFSGYDSFTYKACDGEKCSDIATISIFVDDILVNASDTTAPLSPVIVSIDAQRTSMTLFWLGSTDNYTSDEYIRYEIHISEDENFTANSSTLVQTVVNTLEADVDELNPGTLYYVKVNAVDEAGNPALSDEISVKTQLLDTLLTNRTVKKAAQLHLENALVDGNKLTFHDAAKATLPEKNDILIGTQDDPYLKEVVSASKSGDDVVITTKDVAVTDLIDTASLTSKSILFSLEDTYTQNSPLRRSASFKTNHTQEQKVEWPSKRLSFIDTTNSLVNNNSPRRSAIQDNGSFNIVIARDDVAVVYNETINIDINAYMLQAGKDDKLEFKSLKLVSLSHPTNSDFNNFEAKLQNVKMYANKASAYLQWRPSKAHISLEPYTAKFEVIAKDTECTDYFDSCSDITLYIESKIRVVDNNKVSTGGTINESFNDNIDLSTTVKLDFTPAVTVEHDIVNASMNHVKVLVSGKIDFDVISTFALHGDITQPFTKNLLTRVYPKVYFVGEIPVYQEITFTLDAVLEFAANAKLTATSNLNTSFTLSAGMEYDGNSWEPIKDVNHTQDYTATIQAAGGIKLDVRVVPNIEIKFYKVASAGVSVEPYVQGNIQASYTEYFTESDALGNFNLDDLNLTTGLETKVYADLTIWKVNFAHYPSDGDKKTIFNPNYLIFDLPKIKLEDNRIDVCAKEDYKLQLIVKNPQTPIKNDFESESLKWVVFPSDGAKITPTNGNPLEATFSFTKKDIFKIFATGSSQKISNKYGQQYTSYSVDTRSCDIQSNNDLDDDNAEENDDVIPEDKTPPVFSDNFNSVWNVDSGVETTILLSKENITDTSKPLSFRISGTDVNSFTLSTTYTPDETTLLFKETPDYDKKQHYILTLTAIDANENEASIELNIYVNNPNSDVSGTYNGTYKSTSSNDECLPNGYTNSLVIEVYANDSAEATLTTDEIPFTDNGLSVLNNSTIYDDGLSDQLSWNGTIVKTSISGTIHDSEDNCNFTFTVTK